MWSLTQTQPNSQRVRHPQRAAHVAGPDRRRQPVARAVRPRDRLGLVGERLHRDHRAEDLVLDHLVVLLEPGHDGRARGRSRAGRARPRRSPPRRVSGLRSRKPSTRSRWRAELSGPSVVSAAIVSPTTWPLACSASPDDHVVVDALAGEHARRRRAVLAGVVVAGAGDRLERGLHVHVVEHDHRRLAAELEVHALERVGRRLGDPLAGAGRAGERDHVHVGVGHERRARGLAVAGDHVEHARREDARRPARPASAW